MSYSSGFGEATQQEVCARLLITIGGTGGFPGVICPEVTGMTGTGGPRWCGGAGVYDVQTALQLAGLYPGPVDGKVNPQLIAAVAAIAAQNGIAFDGNPMNVTPNLCGAITRAVVARAPACTGAVTPGGFPEQQNCVLAPSGVADGGMSVPAPIPLPTGPMLSYWGKPKASVIPPSNMDLLRLMLAQQAADKAAQAAQAQQEQASGSVKTVATVAAGAGVLGLLWSLFG